MKLVNTDHIREQYAPFKTIEQLNANTTAIRKEYKHDLSPKAKEVLDILHRYASKFYGVCFLNKNSIAEMAGISRRQVIRICNLFVKMGIIVQYSVDRRFGRGQTANMIVFLTQISAREAFVGGNVSVSDNTNDKDDDNTGGNSDVTNNVTVDVTGLKAPNNASKELKDLKITRDTDAREALSKNGLVSKLPKTLQHALAPFFDADELYEMAGVIFKAKASVDKSVVIEYNEKLYYDAILSVMNAYGRGKVKSVAAVLYRAIERTTSAIVSASRNDVRRNLYGL